MILGLVLILALCTGLFLFFSLNRFSSSTPPAYYPSVPAQPSQTPAANPEPATPKEPVQDGLNDSKGAEDDAAVVPNLSKADIQAELDLLLANRPEMMIECTSCGGSGREAEDCSECLGSGYRIIPGGFGLVNCPKCGGEGHQRCKDCAFGSMKNPNYETEEKAWTERRHELWRQMGYSDAEIKRMEIDEAKAALGNGGSSDDVIWDGGDDSFAEIDTPPGICKICSGTGNCPTCDGDRLYVNPFTGELQTCPNCTDGLCWKCHGSKTS